MPTPHDETESMPSDISASSPIHTTCPPEDRTLQTPPQSEDALTPTESNHAPATTDQVTQMPTPAEEPDLAMAAQATPKPVDMTIDVLASDAHLPTPSSPANDDTKESGPRAAHVQIPPTHSDHPLSRKRVCTTLTMH
jgi:hypothetical protein